MPPGTRNAPERGANTLGEAFYGTKARSLKSGEPPADVPSALIAVAFPPALDDEDIVSRESILVLGLIVALLLKCAEVGDKEIVLDLYEEACAAFAQASKSDSRFARPGWLPDVDSNHEHRG